MFCPGSIAGPDESVIGDGSSGDQLRPRHVTGVSFCIGCGFATYALSIECAWLTLPLIRKGVPRSVSEKHSRAVDMDSGLALGAL